MLTENGPAFLQSSFLSKILLGHTVSSQVRLRQKRGRKEGCLALSLPPSLPAGEEAAHAATYSGT